MNESNSQVLTRRERTTENTNQTLKTSTYNEMTKEDIEIYWPTASETQQKAILIYHNAGYNIMPGIVNGRVEMTRPDTLETVEWLSIDAKGNSRLI